MDEFSLIDTFFKPLVSSRRDVIVGIGDDAACLTLPQQCDLLVSTDTLVSGVHFLEDWDGYDVAKRAVGCTVSDIAAMGGTPTWLTLALTLPEINKHWLERFSQGLKNTLTAWNLALVGGNITRGLLSITLTVHGLIPKGKSVLRSGAKAGDKIYVSGDLGAAAFALEALKTQRIEKKDQDELMQKLLHPIPRLNLASVLQTYATAAIDISDGLSADINHLCQASGLGACLEANTIPIHSTVKKYEPMKGIEWALHGGDDYEICFTVAPDKEQALLASLAKDGLVCYLIGVMQTKKELTIRKATGIERLSSHGYKHF